MKFQCSKSTLNEAVGNVQRAVSTKTTTPALEGILLKTENGKLTICGYDMEICITTAIDANIQEEGASVVKARLFSEIIRKLPENKINIEVDDKNIVYISSGNVDFKIVGIPASDYPEIPVIHGNDTIDLDGEILSGMIRQTIYAIADNDSKPINKGTLFEIENKTLNMVSLDGFRLAMRTETIDYEGDKYFIVPGKSLAEVSKLITEDTKKVKITASGRHIIFRIDNYSVISRLIDGQFINYKASVPTQHITELHVNTRKFIDVIERMSLLLTDKMKSPVRCTIEDGTIKTTCNTTLGQAHDEMQIQMTGEPIEIGFNNKFLLDALKNSETDEIIMEMSGPNKAIIIRPTEGNSFLFLLMPMRLTK